MTREEILKRVFNNSGVMGDVDTVAPPSPSTLYPYSPPSPAEQMRGVQFPERVTPGQAEWYGSAHGGGGLGGLVLPALATAIGGGLPDAAANAEAVAVPQEAYAYQAQAQPQAQEQAQEQRNLAKVQAKEQAVSQLPASVPLELPTMQRDAKAFEKLRAQAQAQTQAQEQPQKNLAKMQAAEREQTVSELPASFPLDLPTMQRDSNAFEKLRAQASNQLAPDQIYLQDKESQLAPDQIYLQDKIAQLAPDQIYLQDLNPKIAPQPVIGSYSIDKEILNGSANETPVNKPKSFFERVGEAFERYENPERYLAPNLASWGLAAPALGAVSGALGAGATAAATPAINNVLQFPTTAQAAQATKPIANNILQFPTQAAAGFGMSALDNQMMANAKPVTFPSTNTALSGDYSSGNEWNPSTQKIKSVNNKAMANTKGLTSPSSSNSASSTTNAVQNLIKNVQSSSLFKNLSNSLAGLKR